MLLPQRGELGLLDPLQQLRRGRGRAALPDLRFCAPRALVCLSQIFLPRQEGRPQATGRVQLRSPLLRQLVALGVLLLPRIALESVDAVGKAGVVL